MADVTESGYTFKATYLNNPEIATGNDLYLLDNEGAGFKKTASADVKITAFRPYFVAPTPPSSSPAPRYIMFNSMSESIGTQDGQEQRDHVSESIEFFAKKHAIVVTSHMQNVADVGIYSASGICIGTFDIQPGETIETPIYNSGVYIIRAAGGHYTHKVTIK